MSKKFAEYSKFDLSNVNKEVLKKWKDGDIFHKSLETREGHPSFVFYEGPPSANGMPGIHHVIARSIKDIFCRYKTMKGFQVKRKAGWDTHGLPVELGVEKSLGITKEETDAELKQLKENFLNIFDNKLDVISPYDGNIEKIKSEEDVILVAYDKQEQGENYTVDFKIPYFNINSENAKKFNQQIKSIFKDKSESVIASDSEKDIVYNVKYK